MKSEFKAKFLQHMIGRKNAEKGFTLIELLVVIIIIGILAAIALPSFLNQAAKAKQSEAKNYVGSINRAQQAYRIENSSFANAISSLELGLSNTTNYTYALAGDGLKGTATAAPSDANSLKSYTGGVFIQTSGANTGQTAAIMCEATAVNVAPVAPTDATTCGTNFKKL